MRPMSSHGSHGHFGDGSEGASPYVELDRDAWAALGRETKSPLSAQEIKDRTATVLAGRFATLATADEALARAGA